MRFLPRPLILWSILIVVLAVLARVFIVGAYQVPTDSMEPAVLTGDFVVGFKKSFLKTQFHRGDVVGVSDAAGTVWVRRVIGMPGDKVEFTAAGLVINDKLLTEDGFESNGEKRWKVTTLPSQIEPAFGAPVIVPLKKFFVLADQRFSKGPLGLIERDRLVGRLNFVWLSLDSNRKIRWERIGHTIE